MEAHALTQTALTMSVTVLLNLLGKPVVNQLMRATSLNLVLMELAIQLIQQTIHAPVTLAILVVTVVNASVKKQCVAMVSVFSMMMGMFRVIVTLVILEEYVIKSLVTATRVNAVGMETVLNSMAIFTVSVDRRGLVHSVRHK